MSLRIKRIRTLKQIWEFLKGTAATDTVPSKNRAEAYRFIVETLVRFEYHHRLPRPGKSLVKRFIEKAAGLSRAQVTRLVAQHRKTGSIRDRRRKPPANAFNRRYTGYDVARLAEVDEATGQLSGPAAKATLHRLYHVHGRKRFKRLAGISNGHIYNLRKQRAYRTRRLTFRGTKGNGVPIAARRKPRPDGKPGYLRVDTVHLGDRDGEKGVYVINIVDEVTQFEHLGAVPRVTHHFLIPCLERLLAAFPFRVEGFHADNGSEYINRRVADMLNSLHVGSFTKSRPRRSNDNGLVESKNGSIVRKWLGRLHVSRELVPPVNAYLDRLSSFLNYHRPCLFPTETVAANGRIKRSYRQEDVATPFDKFKSIEDAECFLKPGVSLESLRLAMQEDDLEAAKGVQKARALDFPLFPQASDSGAHQRQQTLTGEGGPPASDAKAAARTGPTARPCGFAARASACGLLEGPSSRCPELPPPPADQRIACVEGPGNLKTPGPKVRLAAPKAPISRGVKARSPSARASPSILKHPISRKPTESTESAQRRKRATPHRPPALRLSIPPVKVPMHPPAPSPGIKPPHLSTTSPPVRAHSRIGNDFLPRTLPPIPGLRR